MKKYFTRIAWVFVFPLFMLASCNKQDVRNQLLGDPDEAADNGEARHNHHQCGCCPSTAPTAMDVSYSLNFYYPDVWVGVDVSYTNPDADGTFRVVLKNADGSIDSVAIVQASVVDPGQTGTFHLEFFVAPESFPCTLHVNGRPANLDCDVRSRKTFDILNEVSK